MIMINTDVIKQELEIFLNQYPTLKMMLLVIISGLIIFLGYKLGSFTYRLFT